MIIIAGLGNPTKQYEGTRHNAGFRVIDKIADDYGISINKKEFKGLCGSGYIEGQKVLLLKPQTFMNLSGESIRAAADFYKVEPEDVIVIFDDISLDVGQLRIRAKGSAGGHNGIKSIIAHLGSQEFPRIKVGVGEKPSGWDLADYVLGKFSGDDLAKINDAAADASKAVKLMLTDGISAAMNQYNAKKSK
jgi:PTH1 family peptidyl-tRNA hydrolase